MSTLESRIRILDEASSFRREHEKKLEPIDKLDSRKPFVYISVGGGELGDLVLIAAKRILGGIGGGIKTIAIDRYEGFPAQDIADSYEIIDMLNGDLLEKAIRKYVRNPLEDKHAIYLEIERADTKRIFELGIKENYNIISTPYAPLIGMDRLSTKLLFEKVNIPMVDWSYADSEEELRRVARDMGLPLIIKPIMTSSGHGTTIATKWSEVEEAYQYAVKNARGKGDEVIVEKYLGDLKTKGVEIMQLVVRHFNENGKIVATYLPTIDHQRPSATYHESWLPSTLPEDIKHKSRIYAGKIAEYLGGLGVYAVEQFYINGKIYNSEFANRPHDTGMVTRWGLNMDEGALHLLASLGIPVNDHDVDLTVHNEYCVAHVILAPKNIQEGSRAFSWNPTAVYNFMRKKGYKGDIWYFGKPFAYPERRMGLAVAYHKNLIEARKIAEEIAHLAEKTVVYRK